MESGDRNDGALTRDPRDADSLETPMSKFPKQLGPDLCRESVGYRGQRLTE
jgi:hypothetical protein